MRSSLGSVGHYAVGEWWCCARGGQRRPAPPAPYTPLVVRPARRSRRGGVAAASRALVSVLPGSAFALGVSGGWQSRSGAIFSGCVTSLQGVTSRRPHSAFHFPVGASRVTLAYWPVRCESGVARALASQACSRSPASLVRAGASRLPWRVVVRVMRPTRDQALSFGCQQAPRAPQVRPRPGALCWLWRASVTVQRQQHS